MEAYQREFIEFALENNALRFGEFTLKSGRISPYFFNIGQFNTAAATAKLGFFYANAIIHSNIEFDVLFGPAYKGIPLAVATAIALEQHFQKDTPFCFDRKETKDHGEGGNIVGAALTGNVLAIDDVITAGTTVHHVARLCDTEKATFNGLIIALDRQEKAFGDLSAVDEMQRQYKITITTIMTLADIIEYLSEQPDSQQLLQQIQDYQSQYGAAR